MTQKSQAQRKSADVPRGAAGQTQAPKLGGGQKRNVALDALTGEQAIMLLVDLERKGRFGDGQAVAATLTMRHPENATIQYRLGRLAYLSGNFAKAYEHLKVATSLDPEQADWWHDLSSSLQELGHYEAALVAMERALSLAPDRADWIDGHASILISLERYDDALELLDKAIEVDKRLAQAHFNKGRIYEFQKDRAEARVNFRKCLDLKPDHTKALCRLVECTEDADEKETLLKRMRKRLKRSDLDADDRSMLRFVLGTAEDKKKNYDEAFAQFAEANRPVHEQYPFNRRDTEHYYDWLIRAYTPELFKQDRQGGSPSERPIFIVGMPRSGTTLVEQILGSHPDVVPAGESHALKKVEHALVLSSSEASAYPRDIQSFPGDALRALGEEYLRHFPAEDGQENKRFTDKLPFNFVNIGLIRLILPNAKIIHCRRHPLDTCLSCFVENFGSRQLISFSFDLGDLGYMYGQYNRLMDHWRDVVGDGFFDLQYEELVEDQEGMSRKLFDFAGLEWTEDALRFYESERGAHTASLWQVRKPIYRGSMGRWRNYEKHLGPLIEELEKAGVAID